MERAIQSEDTEKLRDEMTVLYFTIGGENLLKLDHNILVRRARSRHTVLEHARRRGRQLSQEMGDGR